MLVVVVALAGCPTVNPQTSDAGTDAPAIDARACIQGETCDCRASLLLPAGTHWVGADQSSRLVDPAHRVTLSRAIWAGAYEASAGCYRRCVDEGACSAPGVSPTGPWPGLSDGYWREPTASDFPIIGLEPSQADAYCAWLGGRLLTNAEWEKLVRGEDGRDFPWLPAPSDPRFPEPTPYFDLCEYEAVPGPTVPGCGRPLPEAIDSMPIGRGPYGHFHLIGNAREYVQDGVAPYSGEDTLDPLVPPIGLRRTVRSVSSAGYQRDDRGIVGVRCAFDTEPEMLSR